MFTFLVYKTLLIELAFHVLCVHVSSFLSPVFTSEFNLTYIFYYETIFIFFS